MVAKNEIGTIEKNTPLGVFGTMKDGLDKSYYDEFLPVGMKQEIKKGKAYLYSKLAGEARKYEINIESIDINSTNNKSMVIRITDQRLLSRTGGIVQGMSGTPILQNGKIIGAVTHVLVDDPTRGYGVFIENMLGA
jgi:stage IV sporulation protein B